MTKIEFESFLRMAKALIKTGNVKALEEVIDETLKSVDNEPKNRAANEEKTQKY